MTAIFWNELSAEGSVDSHVVADQLMGVLAATLARILALDPASYLVAANRLTDLQVGHNYWFRQWAGATGLRDELNLLLRLNDRAPYESVGQLQDDFSLTSYVFEETEVVGLAFAHAFDGIGISLSSDAKWTDAPFLKLSILVLADSSSSLETDDVLVRHIAAPPDIEAHVEFIVAARAGLVVGEAELWENREDLFPRLRFMQRTRPQLRSLHSAWDQPVRERLTELNRAVELWNPNKDAEPSWLSKVTPESESRRHRCWFIEDGVKRLFELHARFTPGAGRIYFRLDPLSGKVVIAHIGSKL